MQISLGSTQFSDKTQLITDCWRLSGVPGGCIECAAQATRRKRTRNPTKDELNICSRRLTALRSAAAADAQNAKYRVAFSEAAARCSAKLGEHSFDHLKFSDDQRESTANFSANALDEVFSERWPIPEGHGNVTATERWISNECRKQSI